MEKMKNEHQRCSQKLAFGKIEAVFLKLGTINVHQKRNKMTILELFP